MTKDYLVEIEWLTPRECKGNTSARKAIYKKLALLIVWHKLVKHLHHNASFKEAILVQHPQLVGIWNSLYKLHNLVKVIWSK